MKHFFCLSGMLPLVLCFSIDSKASNPSGLSDSDYVRLYLANRPEEQQFLQQNALTVKEIRVQPPSLTDNIVNRILATRTRVKRVEIEMINPENVSFIYSCDLNVVYNGKIDSQNVNLSNCTTVENSSYLPTPE